MSVFTPGKLLTDGDILDAVYAFLLAYALPRMDGANIFRGWENRGHLPSDSSDYAVMSIVSAKRVGTNVIEAFSLEDDEDAEVIGTLRWINVQIDFCSLDQSAFSRACSIETIARSPVGVGFFRDRGLSCLYAEPLAALDYQDGSRQQIKRYITTLHLSGWSKITVSVGHAIEVTPRVEDVDWHHPHRT